MLEATEKRGASFGHGSQRLDFHIPSIPEKQDTLVGEGHDGIDILIIWNGPRRQCKMITWTTFIVPSSLHFGTSLGGTPSRSWQEVFQALRKATSRTVYSIHLGQGSKETIIPALVKDL